MNLSEVTLTITLGLLILSEIRYQFIKTFEMKEMVTEKNMLKARIASLEHEITVRDELLKEYHEEYQRLLDRNQSLEVLVQEPSPSSQSFLVDIDDEEPDISENSW
jgi:predicted nuclease with TOPRIM domain